MIARLLRGALALALATPAALATPRALRAQQGPTAPAVADSFPHLRHQRLFTDCTGCHEGITLGDTAKARPPIELCAGCHDGSSQRSVTWRPRPPRGTNLRFDHRRHFEQAGPDCALCHQRSDSIIMDVGRAQPEKCLVCHAEGDATHFAQETCTRCHVPLSRAGRLSPAQITRLPKPPSHDSDWVGRHPSRAASAVCATCHARDYCASCHVNASSVAPIQALERDPRVAQLVRNRRVAYRPPPSHAADGFARTHGLTARRSVTECANCHARESCLGCHREEERVGPVRALPSRRSGGAYGVDLAGIRPPDHGPDHRLRHRVPAAGGDATCSRCHAPSFCASCHDAASSPTFHGLNFVQRHAENAYTRENDCAACHQVQAFCRNCHRTVGQTSGSGAPNAQKFHDNQPYWTLGHAAIARRSIETCATCHQQTDCLKCHSAIRGWGVNPHGPGFDPRMADKNSQTCRLCHWTVPGR
jgi:hypothetical protein